MYTMNRCLLAFKHRLTALLAAAAAGLALTLCAPVAAQTAPQRIPPIPQAAQGGVLVVAAPPEVLLDGKAARLSPGARIHGLNNLLVMSGSLIGQPLRVRYVRDTLGLIHEVWLLTEAEAAAFAQSRP
jgi:hypothetical protein